MDILIYVPKKYRDEKNEEDEYFFWHKVSHHPLDEDWEFFWTLQNIPKHITINSSLVKFTDGTNIIAEGPIIGADPNYIYFNSLKKVCYPQPKKAPTRGFTYIDNKEENRQ